MLHADNCYWIPNIRIESHRLQDQHPIRRGRLSRALAARKASSASNGSSTTSPTPSALIRLRSCSVTSTRRWALPPQTTLYGMEVEDSITDKILAKLIETSAYRARKTAIDAFNATSPDLEEGHRCYSGQVRILVYPVWPGSRRGAGACLSGRLGHREPRRDRDGTGPEPEGGPSHGPGLWP